MKQLEILDKIILEDNLNLTSSEIIERVQYIAEEKALKYSWESFEIKPTEKKPTILSTGYHRYEFTVWGLPNEQVGQSEDDSSSSEKNQKTDLAASSLPSPEIDL